MRLGVFQFSTRKFPLEWKRRIFMALAGEQAPVAADQAGHNIDALKGTGFHNRSACEKRSLKCRKLARLEGFEPPSVRLRHNRKKPDGKQTVMSRRSSLLLHLGILLLWAHAMGTSDAREAPQAEGPCVFYSWTATSERFGGSRLSRVADLFHSGCNVQVSSRGE